jgi:transcriptional/translational regulatory protein YebC/TACO1
MLLVADAGGEDLEDNGEDWVVYTASADLLGVSKALEGAGMAVKGAELVMEPTTPAAVTVEDAKKVMRLVDKLEESDDIQNVYTTMDITDEIAEALDA